ncbi:hypothetical protein BGZ75_000150, partial [Mortierella antarctica]
IFRAQGPVVHELGALVPREGRRPSFAQIYFYDPAEQMRRRLAVFLPRKFAIGQQQVQPQNQQENQLQEDVPVEDDLDPYDPTVEDAVD